MRRALIALLLLALVAAPAAGQGLLRRPQFVAGEAMMDPRLCNLPQLPEMIVARWVPNAERDRITWCMDIDPAKAQALLYTLHVSDASLETAPSFTQSLAPVCVFAATVVGAPEPNRAFCSSYLHPDLVQKLLTPGGVKRLQLSSRPNLQTPDSALSAGVLYDVPRCNPVIMNGDYPAIDQSGALNNIGDVISRRQSWNLAAHARAVTWLRQLGWRVEWTRTQFEAPSTATSGDGGHYYLIAECLGVPQ